MRWAESSSDNLLITNSPYWKNTIGHDLEESELVNTVTKINEDDITALKTASDFFYLLIEEPLENNTLREMVTRSFWKHWISFEQVAKALKTINNPGISTCVEHLEGETKARVKILPNVDKGFVITEPQLIHIHGAYIHLIKQKKKWKVNKLEIMQQPTDIHTA